MQRNFNDMIEDISEDDFLESARKVADDHVPETTFGLMYHNLENSKADLKNGEIKIAQDIDILSNAQGKKINIC